MKEDPYVKLAKESLEYYLKNKKVMKKPDDLPQEMLKKQAGVFVSLKKQGDLRGCIGTTQPTTNSVADEIIQNAVSAGTRDPRFPPVKEKELNQLNVSVDVLLSPEPIDSLSELNPIKYGVIVKKGRRSGLLLPNLEGIDTAEDQVNIALRKAGIFPNEDYSLEKFEVIRHK